MNIKKFEELEADDKRYWLIRCDHPFLEIGLYKLDVSKENRERFLKNTLIKKYKNIYIAPYFGVQTWSGFMSEGKNHFDANNFDYQGKLKITSEDIENWKIKKEANKYNL